MTSKKQTKLLKYVENGKCIFGNVEDICKDTGRIIIVRIVLVKIAGEKDYTLEVESFYSEDPADVPSFLKRYF